MKPPTNKYSIPDRIIKLLPLSRRPVRDRMSVTHLINSPLIRTLLLEKWDDIQLDWSVLLLRAQGVAWHKFVESFATDDEAVEVKLEDVIDGWTLVGKADNYTPDNGGIIIDAKQTKVGSVNFDDTIEKWTQQCNVYAFQRRKRGFPVSKLFADVIFRDWYAKDVVRKRNYPKCPYLNIELDLWDFKQQESFVHERLRLHREESHKECSPKDKWQKKDSFVIMKKGQKKAHIASVPGSGGKIPILTKFKAEEIIREKNLTNDYDCGKIVIVKRAGENTHCSPLYCDCTSVCPYYKKES